MRHPSHRAFLHRALPLLVVPGALQAQVYLSILNHSVRPAEVRIIHGREGLVTNLQLISADSREEPAPAPEAAITVRRTDLLVVTMSEPKEPIQGQIEVVFGGSVPEFHRASFTLSGSDLLLHPWGGLPAFGRVGVLPVGHTLVFRDRSPLPAAPAAPALPVPAAVRAPAAAAPALPVPAAVRAPAAAGVMLRVINNSTARWHLGHPRPLERKPFQEVVSPGDRPLGLHSGYRIPGGKTLELRGTPGLGDLKEVRRFMDSKTHNPYGAEILFFQGPQGPRITVEYDYPLPEGFVPPFTIDGATLRITGSRWPQPPPALEPDPPFPAAVADQEGAEGSPGHPAPDSPPVHGGRVKRKVEPGADAGSPPPKLGRWEPRRPEPIKTAGTDEAGERETRPPVKLEDGPG